MNAKKKHLKSNSTLACKWGKVSDPSQSLVALISIFLKTNDVERLCIPNTCLFLLKFFNLPMLIVSLILLRFKCSVYSPSLNVWFGSTFSQSVDFSLNYLSVFQRARVFNFGAIHQLFLLLIVLSDFLKSCACIAVIKYNFKNLKHEFSF